MNKRQRKKWLKEHNAYVNPRDTWALYLNITNYILPRLEMFKKVDNGFPGRDGMDTPEKWDEALDKMILAFKYIKNEDHLGDMKEYNYLDEMDFKTVRTKDENGNIHFDLETSITPLGEEIKKSYLAEIERRDIIIEEGLNLFAKYFRYLWW